MTQHPDESSVDDEAETPGQAERLGAPTLAEDLLLLLFQPGTGTIAGENTLFHPLAGAVLADLALGEHVRTESGRAGTTRVAAIEEHLSPIFGGILLSAGLTRDKPRYDLAA